MGHFLPWIVFGLMLASLHPVTEASPLKTSIKLSGVVKNALLSTRLPLVTVTDVQQTLLASTNADGYFEFSVPLNTPTTTLFFEAPGFLTATIENIDPSSGEDIFLEPVSLISDDISGLGVVSGLILNSLTGAPEDRVTVSFYQGAILRQSVETSSDGFWTANLDTEYYTAVLSKTGFVQSSSKVTVLGGYSIFAATGAISPVFDAESVRVVLSWKDVSLDLSSHLTGLRTTGSFHVSADNRGSATVSPFSTLDVVDLDGLGIEALTIHKVEHGVSRFIVCDENNKDLSEGATALANSGAKVEIYQGNSLLKTFNVPNVAGTSWTVFEISQSGLVPVNAVGYEFLQ